MLPAILQGIYNLRELPLQKSGDVTLGYYNDIYNTNVYLIWIINVDNLS